MADYTNPLIITSPSAERGDDVYAKSATPWQPDPWQQQMQHGEPLAGQAAWELPAGTGGLQTDETYLVFVNSAFRACTADDSTDVITSVAHGLTVGTRVYFRSSVNPDGIVLGTPYWVDSVTTDTFKLKANEDLSGSFVDLGSEGTAVYFVATSYRSSADEQIGTIPATDVYIGEGEAAGIIAAFKADADLGTATGGLVANVVDIKAKTDLIGTGSAVVSAPVSGDGDLLELILETDYLAANGRALEWTFDEITGITTSATGKFGLKDADTGTEVYVNTTGTVTDLGSGTFKVSFDITNAALNALSPGKYDWSVEVLEGSYKITVARNRQIKTRVDIVEKQT